MFETPIGTELLISFIAFICVALPIYFASFVFDHNRIRVQRRLHQLSSDQQEAYGDNESYGDGSFSDAFPSTDRSDNSSSTWLFDAVELRDQIAMAGMDASRVYPLLQAVRSASIATVVPACLVLVRFELLDQNQALPFAFVIALCVWMTPRLWLKRLVSRYRVKLGTSLPDFLDLLIICLDAGMSLQEGIKRVAAELKTVHPLLASELATVQRDIELGASIDLAFKRFALRTQFDAVRSLSTLVRESQRFGTRITDALRGHAEMLRHQREQTAEEKAHKASVKIMLPVMLCIFPGIFIVLVSPAAIQIHQSFSGQ